MRSDFLNPKACFELIVQNNFDSESITDEIYRRGINASYQQVYDDAFKYYKKDADSNNRSRYQDAYSNYKRKIDEDDVISDTLYNYVNLNCKNRKEYIDINSMAIKKAASEFNIPKTRVLELYYLCSLKRKGIKMVPRNQQSEISLFRKYLFYIYINHHLDATVFQYIPYLQRFSNKHSNYQKKLENVLIPYVDSTCLIHITDSELKYLNHMLSAHKNSYGYVLNENKKNLNKEKNELDYLNSLSDEEMIKYFDKVDSKKLKSWLSLGLDHTEYFRIYQNLVKYDDLMEEKARNIFFNDLENHSFLSSMFLCVKKIIPCLEKDDYVNLPANINKYLVNEEFNYLDLCAMTRTPVDDLIKFVRMLKRYDDGRFFDVKQYVLLENFLKRCVFDGKNKFFYDFLLENDFNMEKELGVKRVIHHHEVSRDDVNRTVQFLEKWQIPLCLSVYHMALKRLVDNDLDNRYYAFSDYGHSSWNDIGRSR